MPSVQSFGKTLDVRPDRLDYRDLPYRPRLESLPSEHPDSGFIAAHFANYKTLVLDQGGEGSCTGFGLAAMVNYLRWFRHMSSTSSDLANPPGQVSPAMLYQLARIYDEWPGEDYDGSSCRGAMKGWHHHGVCARTLWADKAKTTFRKPKQGWQASAAETPLGAYYRVDPKSLNDIQSAIVEVGAVYASAMVHEGWNKPTADPIPVIPYQTPQSGGHAFALVGYTKDGLIVQNSWGDRWGRSGFAILTYADWFENSMDAWTAALGAPIRFDNPQRTRTSISLQEGTNRHLGRVTAASDSFLPRHQYNNPKVYPIEESQAYEYTVVYGNDGRTLNRHVDQPNARAALREVALENPSEWINATGHRRIAIFAHGGLNGEKKSLIRNRVLAPYFLENDIYPIFLTWRTGPLETIKNIVADIGPKRDEEARAEGVFKGIKRALREAADRALEAAARVAAKPIWSEMKENARLGSSANGGLNLLADALQDLRGRHAGTEIHLINHSAGSLLHGHLLDRLATRSVKVRTCTMWAPACSTAFALDHYRRKPNILRKSDLHFELLTDQAERADQLVGGLYGKSLLYLVSRALEGHHKTPLLGMEASWRDIPGRPDLWHKDLRQAVKEWRRFVGASPNATFHASDEQASDGVDAIKPNHGHFDNGVQVLTRVLRRIRGGSKLATPVEFLRY